MLKNQKGMALLPLIITIFVVLALAGATVFMIGDGILYNKDVKSTVNNKANNTIEDSNNTVSENNSVNNTNNNASSVLTNK